LKKFSGGYTPGPPLKRRGKGRTEGERRGLGTQLGRMEWYGTEKERKGREGKGREEGRKMTWPPDKKFLDLPLFSS
jgi:hypothetical protein